MSALTLHRDLTPVTPVVTPVTAAGDVVEATVDLDPAEARELTDRLRGLVVEAVALLRTAYFGRAWVALGYPSWAAYLATELGGALAGLPPADRDEAIVVLRESGMSWRAIGASTGRSTERARDAVARLRPDGIDVASVGTDGKTYARSAPAAAARSAAVLEAPRPLLAIAGPRKTTTALDLLEAAGTEGLTIPELQRKKRWSYTQTSTTLSRLNASRDGDGLRRVERLVERRGQYAVYVLPEYVAVDGVARDTLLPGQRLRRA